MSHSLVSIDALIRKGTSLKNKIGMIARNLEDEANDYKENLPCLAKKTNRESGTSANPISFITPLSNGLEQAISDVFSLICSFKGIDHGGIYILNQHRKQLDLVCHYNLPDEFLARAIRFYQDSWQVNALLEGVVDFNGIQKIPLHARIAYEQHGIQSIALMPLIYQGQIVGCLNLASQKEVFVNRIEKMVIEGLALRISRIVALHLAQLRLTRANEGLTILMKSLRSRFQVARSSEPKHVNGPFAGMKSEIEGLCTALSLASDKIMQKMKDGLQKRELPFLQKKVDALLQDIDLIVQIFVRLRFFCMSQSVTTAGRMLQHNNNNNDSFLDSLADFYQSLEVLVMNDNKQRPANTAYIAGKFEPLSRPLKLTDLNITINRLTPN